MFNRRSKPVLPRHHWQGLTAWQRIRRWLLAWRPWALLAALLTLWYWFDGALVAPPEMLSGTPEQISGKFTRCGRGRSANCVIDGDTFALGARHIRIIGIDAPEVHEPRCDAEAQLGQQATDALLAELNAAPFIITGRMDDVRDKYGRELKAVTRQLPDGSVQSIGDVLIAKGAVHSYLGGLRGGWCG